MRSSCFFFFSQASFVRLFSSCCVVPSPRTTRERMQHNSRESLSAASWRETPTGLPRRGRGTRSLPAAPAEGAGSGGRATTSSSAGVSSPPCPVPSCCMRGEGAVGERPRYCGCLRLRYSNCFRSLLVWRCCLVTSPPPPGVGDPHLFPSFFQGKLCLGSTTDSWRRRRRCSS